MAEQSEQSDLPAESGQTVAVPVATKPAGQRSAKPRSDNEPPPRHAVILHNDHHTSPEFVIETLVKVLKIDSQRAEQFMYTAHRTGRCAVWTGLKEHAELKASQITGRGPDPAAVKNLGDAATPLKATVEPVPGT